MRGFLPKRPAGNSPEIRFMQWVYDELLQIRLQDSPDSVTSRTTKGFVTIPKIKKGGAAGGINYRGDWDATKSYAVNDLVRKRSGAGSVTGFVGWALCVKAPPAGTAPEFPEPNDANPANTTYWHIMGLGIATFVACRNGQGKQTYIQLFEVS